MQIIDITHTISAEMPIYPGNPEVSIETLKSESGLTYLSRLSLGSHTGTHIDAPRHVSETGKSVDKLDLAPLIGPCRVLDLTSIGKSIRVKDLEPHNIQAEERILLKTSNSTRPFDAFYPDYTYLSPEAATYLSELPLTLMGIDYLSIKERGSTDNTPHTAFLNRNIPILEALDLSSVEPGSYNLTCLPMKIKDIDGAPVRAVLTK